MKKLSTIITLSLLILAIFSVPVKVTAGEPHGRQIQIMVVGNHYLPADIMKSSRQDEADAVTQGLALFNPDKILMDIPYQSIWEKSMNQKYQAFLRGNYALNRSYQEQLGFRLAKRMGIDFFQGIDISSGYNLGNALQNISMNGYAKNVSNLVEMGKGIEYAKREHADQGNLASYLTYLNNEDNLAYEHSLYVKGLSEIRGEFAYEATNILSKWYQYHMHLFANIIEATKGESQRVVLMVDSSHIPVLKELIKSHPDYKWVDPTPYLEVQ